MLVDGDDFNEPIADAARSILDGHIVLTRKLAGGGPLPGHRRARQQEPRARPVIDDAEKHAANALLRLEAAYREKEDLILVGAYQKGSDPQTDAAIELRDGVLGFLRQPPTEATTVEETRRRLATLASQAELASRKKA